MAKQSTADQILKGEGRNLHPPQPLRCFLAISVVTASFSRRNVGCAGNDEFGLGQNLGLFAYKAVRPKFAATKDINIALVDLSGLEVRHGRKITCGGLNP